MQYVIRGTQKIWRGGRNLRFLANKSLYLSNGAR